MSSNRKQPPSPDVDTAANGKVLSSVEYLTLDEIRRDGGTQPRAAIDLKHVKLLSEQMEDGFTLEAIAVFYDGESYWLADGFHRWQAHHNREEEVIACVIHQGSHRDAVLYSVGANADHKPALPRSRTDKRRAVMTLLQDPEWKEWSDREIGRQCKVSQPFVSKLRGNLTDNIFSENSRLTDNVISDNTKRTYKTKHGTVAKMNTAKIGKSGKQADPPREGDDSVPNCLKIGNRVTVKDDHPLFPGQSGKITQFPNPDAAIVELDGGSRELIYLRYLNVEQLSLNVEQAETMNHVELAHHLKLVQGGLVEIHTPNNNKIDHRLGRIAAVHDSTVEVWVRDVSTMTMYKYTLRHQQVEAVGLENEPQCQEVCLRIHALRQCNLDPFEVEILSLLERPVAFTPVELGYLAQIEQRHEIGES
ncbi:MAG: ParB N-terminal domain-containing protein [Calothrix sp. MO_192.B10]|nr:ParB N-terminal domain-containing protein [Calothrix sp. MO_192.B10]